MKLSAEITPTQAQSVQGTESVAVEAKADAEGIKVPPEAGSQATKAANASTDAVEAVEAEDEPSETPSKTVLKGIV